MVSLIVEVLNIVFVLLLKLLIFYLKRSRVRSNIGVKIDIIKAFDTVN